ncbi:MAG: MBL fold metallo-hydrolase [Anaerolineae bacterium]|jgi:glyoxylase-like metal-dependent hydrolase (beta-lactamase superfamily II)|nr:MBL fold metallo-hydrolase [Anaerolineae bacterium]MBT3713830.1 MBL fold metallo-hydrolase [Anaerolineae bacterium]MBT4309389.1 MBL fold metallo-hydrolase [Anaerolineae bacterium]MBT4459203.1 MBL fold metallo-hydrolase [Anaerolineae bacterium]MBT4840818.1 MBL fold metallo-hydrolase [Anaerolineae bacterium]
MHRERVSDNVYWFQSDVYAQVTAGVVVGPKWSVLIDTLALPEEANEIRDFVEHNLQSKIRYVINTHYHADHSWGNCFFPDATIIAHTRCRELLAEQGIPALKEAKKQSPIFEQVEIVLPNMTLDNGEMILQIGKKHLKIIPAPGHSEDGIAISVVEDRVLFAGDTFMPIPYLLDGNIEELRGFYEVVRNMTLENIVQGHGEVILRGEVEPTIDGNLEYIALIEKIARTALRRKAPMEYLAKQDIEKCGKSRILLGGLATGLHEQNLQYVYDLALKKAKAEA